SDQLIVPLLYANTTGASNGAAVTIPRCLKAEEIGKTPAWIEELDGKEKERIQAFLLQAHNQALVHDIFRHVPSPSPNWRHYQTYCTGAVGPFAVIVDHGAFSVADGSFAERPQFPLRTVERRPKQCP